MILSLKFFIIFKIETNIRNGAGLVTIMTSEFAFALDDNFMNNFSEVEIILKVRESNLFLSPELDLILIIW